MWSLFWFCFGILIGAIIWNTKIRREVYLIITKSWFWFMKFTDKMLRKIDIGEKP